MIFGEEKGRRLSAWSRKTSSFSRGNQWFESLLLYQRVAVSLVGIRRGLGMAREINTREIVCLSVLRGKSSKESCEEVERATSRIYSQNYIDSLRSRAKNLIRMRCRELEAPPMSFAVLREIVEFSAKYDPPLTERALRQLANAANIDQDVVVQKHQERHEHHVRAQVRGVIVDRWTWSLY